MSERLARRMELENRAAAIARCEHFDRCMMQALTAQRRAVAMLAEHPGASPAQIAHARADLERSEARSASRLAELDQIRAAHRDALAAFAATYGEPA